MIFGAHPILCTLWSALCLEPSKSQNWVSVQPCSASLFSQGSMTAPARPLARCCQPSHLDGRHLPPTLVLTKDKGLPSWASTQNIELPHQVNRTLFQQKTEELEIAVTLCSFIWNKWAISIRCFKILKRALQPHCVLCEMPGCGNYYDNDS
jgi:hypothetical protein